MDVEKRIKALRDRLTYISDIFVDREDESIRLLKAKFGELLERHGSRPGGASREELARIEDLFNFSERKLDTTLSPMDRVRIVPPSAAHLSQGHSGKCLRQLYRNRRSGANTTSIPACS